MGKLKLECLATNGIDVYGLAIEPINANAPEQGSRHVLVKTDATAKDVNAMTWTLVSSIRSDAVENEATLCTVDEQGVFTALGSILSTDISKTTYGGGCRYDPTYPANSNVELMGKGGWKKVTPPQVGWMRTTEYRQRTILMLLRDSTGAQQVVFVHYKPTITNSVRTQSQIQFATLDPTTLTFPLGPSWVYSPTESGIGGDLSSFAFYKDNLYAMTWSGTQTNITAFSFPSGGSISTSLPIITPAMITDTSKSTMGCVMPASFSGMFVDMVDDFFLMNCNMNGLPSATLPQQVVSINFQAALTVLREPMPLMPRLNSFLKAYVVLPGGSGPPGGTKTPFLLFSDNTYSIHGVNLVGSGAGKWQNVTHAVNITENIGDPIAGSGGSGESGGSGGDGSSSKNGMIVGIVGAVLVAAGLVYWLVFRKRRAAATAAGQALEVAEVDEKPLPPPKKDPTFPQKGQHETHLVEYQSSQKMPHEQSHDASGPYHLTASTMVSSQKEPINMSQGYEASPGMQNFVSQPAAPVPQHQQQHHQQTFIFSSHPQPNFVTTAGDETTQPGSASYGQARSDVWEPQPFIPPTAMASSGSGSPLIPTHSRPSASAGSTLSFTPDSSIVAPEAVVHAPQELLPAGNPQQMPVAGHPQSRV